MRAGFECESRRIPFTPHGGIGFALTLDLPEG